jgi:CO/xanthine dehydrogenase Mo-binding subunit/aerobic-type carbon monoxide dehydrogenase small subunit (CoxS/CutS family)
MGQSDHRERIDTPVNPGRRSFLGQATKTAAVGIGAGMGLLHADQVPAAASESPSEETGSLLSLSVNGSRYRLRVADHRTLLEVLREDLGLTGTKSGCNRGQCGACTVLLDGEPCYACSVLAADAAGREVLTIEGLECDGVLHPVQEAFIEAMGGQCGFCSPGMILSAVALLAEHPRPSPEQIRAGLAGNLCRCGNYPNAIAAVLRAAEIQTRRLGAPRLATGDLPHGPRTPPVLVDKAADSASAERLDSRIPVLDAYAKFTGRARFTADLGLHPDDEVRRPLVAKVLRSPYPHADVVRIDDSRAKVLPGYHGMVTWRDVPDYPGDRRFLNQRARYVGDAVAAIAAADAQTASEALALLDVTWRERPVYPDPEHNLRHGVEVQPGGPVAGFGGPQPADLPTLEYRSGDLDAAFAVADLVIEGRYETQIHCHAPIEPHACIARFDNGALTVWDSQQSIFAAREALARALGLPLEKVRVVCDYLGGGFGGKCADTLGKTLYQGIAALLARKTGRPVRLTYTLDELLLAEDVRNPFIFEIRTGVKRDGTLTAIDCRAVQATGGYASSGPAVVSVAGEGIINTYRCDAYRFQGFSVYTTSPVGGEFRAFGHPQAVFARESHMDRIAERLGMDPLELRRRNSKRAGDPITLGVASDVPLEAIGAERCLDLGAQAIGWERRRPTAEQSGRLRRGLGMRFSQEHTGRSDSDAILWVDRQGRVHLPMGVGNLGTCAHTAVALIAAEVLDMPVSAIQVSWGDTEDVAWDFVTDASRSVHCTGKAIYNAALDLVAQLKTAAAEVLDADGTILKVRAGRVHQSGTDASVDFRTLARRAAPRADLTPRFDPATDINPLLDESTGVVTVDPAMRLHPSTERLARRLLDRGGLIGLGHYVFNPSVQAWGASFAEVEVDTETGRFQVLRLVGVHDIGRLIHRPGAEAQVLGGSIMSLGHALTEELRVDPRYHIPVGVSLLALGIPTIQDYGEIVPMLVEAPVRAGPFGAKGLGENPMLNAAGAVANALANATGARLNRLPLTWSSLYRALGNRA